MRRNRRGRRGGDSTGGDIPSEPAVDEDWLELPSGMDGSQYLVNTYYSGSTRNYTHLYDTSTMTSLWTAYPLRSSDMGSLSREDSWTYSPAIDTQYQVNVTGGSYNSSGFDSRYSRGHMCPNASRNGDATMQAQTFYVTNQVPQIQNGFNGGIWMSLERGAGRGEKQHIGNHLCGDRCGLPEDRRLGDDKLHQSKQGFVAECPHPELLL